MYVLERFGSITLPTYNTTRTLSPVAAQLAFIQTASGTFDSDGSGRNRQNLPHPLRYQADVNESTVANSRTLLDSLRASVGIRGTLYRRALDDSSIHTCTARLSAMPYEGQLRDRAVKRTITLEFQQLSRWRGQPRGVGWHFDEGIIFDDGHVFDQTPPIALNTTPKTIVVTNGGNLPVRDVQIVITSQVTAIDVITLKAPGIDINWSSHVVPGTSVVIDAGSWSILNNGVDAYSGLTLGANHNLENWLEFPPGVTNLIVTRDVGSATCTCAVIFYDGWA
jgi:hypothetical protein